MDYSTFRVAEMKKRVANTFAAFEAEKKADRPLINIDKLDVPESILPYIEKVNNLINMQSFKKAAETADYAINERPDSAAGWFAKIAALTHNFSPANFCSEDSGVDLTLKEFVLLKKNALSMVSDANSAYVSSVLGEYEKKCIRYLEAGSCSRFLDIQEKMSNPQFRQHSDLVCAIVRDSLAEGFSTNPTYEYIAKQYPESLILCCEYTILYLNKINGDRQNKYYGKKPGDNILDLVDQRPLKYLELSKTTLIDQMRSFGFTPRQSEDFETDGFISLMIYVGNTIGINTEGLKHYYSASARSEVASIEEIEKSNREAERQRRKAAEDRRREEAARKEREEKERRENEAKKKKSKGIITKIAIIIAVIATLITVSPAIKDLVSEIFEQGTTSIYENSEYYIMSDDYTHINVRSGPGTDSSVITVLDSQFVRMYPTGNTDGNWIEVDSPDFGIGWVSNKVVQYVYD